eukprot:scaffold89443_cov14-Tisochrysis_lutea.AAC.1
MLCAWGFEQQQGNEHESEMWLWLRVCPAGKPWPENRTQQKMTCGPLLIPQVGLALNPGFWAVNRDTVDVQVEKAANEISRVQSCRKLVRIPWPG